MQVPGNDIQTKNLSLAETAAQLFLGGSLEPSIVSMRVKGSDSASTTEASNTKAWHMLA